MNIVISGASSGIGLRTAEKFAALGHTVYNISRSSAGVAHVIDVLADLADPRSATAAIEKIAKECGRIDIAVYSAGYAIAGSISDVSIEDLARITQVDYLSAVYFVKAAEAAMLHRGKIILISSLAAYFPLPYEPAYSAAKAAMLAFTRALAQEWKHSGMSICCLTPGGVCTSFSRHRQKVYGKTENPNLNAAISAITDIEQGGKLADAVADKIISLIDKTKLPVTASACLGDAMLIGVSKMMSAKATDAIITKKFNQRKPEIVKVLCEAKPRERPEIIDLTNLNKSASDASVKKQKTEAPEQTVVAQAAIDAKKPHESEHQYK